MTETLPRPRPTFVLASSLTPEEVRRAVATFLKANERIKGMTLLERIEMSFVRKEQHLWSPQLIVDVEKGGEGCTLRARFGPHPHVWTMYMAIYFVLGVLALLAISYGYSQDRVGESPTTLYALPSLTWSAKKPKAICLTPISNKPRPKSSAACLRRLNRKTPQKPPATVPAAKLLSPCCS